MATCKNVIGDQHFNFHSTLQIITGKVSQGVYTVNRPTIIFCSWWPLLSKICYCEGNFCPADCSPDQHCSGFVLKSLEVYLRHVCKHAKDDSLHLLPLRSWLSYAQYIQCRNDWPFDKEFLKQPLTYFVPVHFEDAPVVSIYIVKIKPTSSLSMFRLIWRPPWSRGFKVNLI